MSTPLMKLKLERMADGMIQGIVWTLATEALLVLGIIIFQNFKAWLDWRGTDSAQQGYSMFNRAWKHIPHRHRWRGTVQGIDLKTGQRILGRQCLRCWRSEEVGRSPHDSVVLAEELGQ